MVLEWMDLMRVNTNLTPSRWIRPLLSGDWSLLIYASVVLVILVISGVLYGQTKSILREQLRRRLMDVAATAAIQFDPEDVVAIRDARDYRSPAFERVVETLLKVQEANPNVRYAYVMRRTSDPTKLTFVADAFSTLPFEELDANGDGVLDETEVPPMPGDDYDISDVPMLQEEAFDRPTADEELIPDQWGLIMAGYAPVRDADGETIAVLGLDVLVDDFNLITRATGLPFIIFIFFLLSVITLLAVSLVQVWRSRLQFLEEIDRKKDEFLSIASHQLRTPLSAMTWQLELLLDGDAGALTRKQRQVLAGIAKDNHRLVELLTALLDISRMEMGRRKVKLERFSVAALVREVCAEHQARADASGITLHVDASIHLPLVTLDRDLLRMTVENLVSNAVKYTGRGGKVAVDLQWQRRTLVCTVADTGCGIPHRQHASVFQKFFRADNARGICAEGTGLGLYIAKSALEMQGGSISFTSRERRGTTFVVRIPLAGAVGGEGRVKRGVRASLAEAFRWLLRPLFVHS